MSKVKGTGEFLTNATSLFEKAQDLIVVNAHLIGATGIVEKISKANYVKLGTWSFERVSIQGRKIASLSDNRHPKAICLMFCITR